MLGFLLISCSNGLTTWAIKFIPSYLGALISSSMPFVMVLASFLFFKEKIKPLAVVGLLIGFGGVVALMSSFFEELTNNNFMFGVIITLVGVCTWTTRHLTHHQKQASARPLCGYWMANAFWRYHTVCCILGYRAAG